MGLAVMALLLARMQRARLRWGVTFTGLTLASGRAVYPAMAVVGASALATGQAVGPPAAGVVAAAVCGLLGGGLYGLIPRRPRLGAVRKPTIRRVGVCAMVGAVSQPMFMAFGALSTPMSPGAAAFVLGAGFTGMACYLVAQYRRAQAAHARAGVVPAAAYR